MTASLSPPPCQVSDYSKHSRFAALCCRPLSGPAVVHPLRPPHSVPSSAESCPDGGGGTQAVLLQRYADASGDGPGVRCLRYGPASTQSTDPGGVCDSTAPARQHTWSVRPGGAGAALQEEEQAQEHAMYSGVNAVSHKDKTTRTQYKINQFSLILVTCYILCIPSHASLVSGSQLLNHCS